MIRNYNGNVNRSILRGLKELCALQKENFKTLWGKFSEDGKVSFYTDLDFLTGCPDEMSRTVTLASEAEIKEYLKNDFKERLEMFFDSKKPDEDYLLNILSDFLKENGGVFPSEDEMKKLEQKAELQRIAELSADDASRQAPNEEQKILKEILEFSEEIMELRRARKPDDIEVHVEPYDDELGLETEDFYATISYDRYYASDSNKDYTCSVSMRKSNVVDTIEFQYGYYDDLAYANAHNWIGAKLELPSIYAELITVHKALAEIAEKEGLEFISEVEYSKLSA